MSQRNNNKCVRDKMAMARFFLAFGPVGRCAAGCAIWAECELRVTHFGKEKESLFACGTAVSRWQGRGSSAGNPAGILGWDGCLGFDKLKMSSGFLLRWIRALRPLGVRCFFVRVFLCFLHGGRPKRRSFASASHFQRTEERGLS